LFATHYFELTALPEKHPRASNVHVGVAEAGDDIVFLHELQAGPASRSYGVQVARLAGMPPSLIRQARAALDALETQQRQHDDQIDLFADLGGGTHPAHDLLVESAAVPASAHAPTQAESATLALLARIDPDALTPREALDALYQLKQLVANSKPE
ncbi:MAG: DNA mismatch repair protein MutS, partial [Lacisediminimonas sp.]|nr:DNA mismatch repair protein MutS [Lacisediminimonas sp.]